MDFQRNHREITFQTLQADLFVDVGFIESKHQAFSFLEGNTTVQAQHLQILIGHVQDHFLVGGCPLHLVAIRHTLLLGLIRKQIVRILALNAYLVFVFEAMRNLLDVVVLEVVIKHAVELVFEGQRIEVLQAHTTLELLQSNAGIDVQFLTVLSDIGGNFNTLIVENEVPFLTSVTRDTILGLETVINLYLDAEVVGHVVGRLATLASLLLTFIDETVTDWNLGGTSVLD